MPTQSDYDFGNALVELDLISLDRVREGLREQQELADKGQVGRTLEQLLLLKGYISPAQVAMARMRMKMAKPAEPAPAPGVDLPSKPPPSSAFASAPPSFVAAPSGPVQIPGFTILQKVGAGGAGDVYSARQLSMDRVVAIKVLSSRLARDSRYTERFIREARAAAKLSHPNIITVHDVAEHQGTYYMVMEFIDGPTLEKLLGQRGVLDENMVANLALQTARALDVAHRNMIVHRDVKPGNIMLLSDGTAKLCDLGLARAADDGEAEGKAVGTPRYISPEQAKDEPDIDIRSDLYSLGATMYHLVTGELPFPADNPRSMMQKHVSEPLVPPKERWSGISGELNAIIVRLMEKDRRNRFQTPGDLISALEEFTSRMKRAPAPVAHAGPPQPLESAPRSKPPTESRPAIRAVTYSRTSRGAGGNITLITFMIVFIGGGVFLFRDRIQGALQSPGTPPPPRRSPPPVAGKPIPSGMTVGDALAQEELDIIAQYQSKDGGFESMADIVKRYDAYEAKYRHQKWESKAHERRREYLERADKFAQEELASIRGKEKALRTEERYRDILRLYDAFPRKFLNTTPTGDIVKEEMFNLHAQINERYLKDKAALEEMIRGRRYTEALSAIAEMEAYALTEQLEELTERRRGLDRLKKTEENKVATEVRDKYLLLDSKLRGEMSGRNYRQAILVIKDALWGGWDELEVAFVRPAGTDYDALKKRIEEAEGAQQGDTARLCWGRVLSFIEPAIGDPENLGEITTAQAMLLDLRNAVSLELFRMQFIDGMIRVLRAGEKERYDLAMFPGEPGHFERRTNIMFVIPGKRAVEIDPWSQLLEPDLVAIAARSYAEERGESERAAGKDAVFSLRCGLLYYYSRAGATFSARAMENLEQASRMGIKGVRVYLGDVSAAVKTVVEEESRKKFAEAQGLFGQKQYSLARTVLEELSRMPSKFVKEHYADIEKLMADCAAQLLGSNKFAEAYGGKVDPLDGGRLRVTYDFEDKKQAGFFETLTLDGKIKGKWRVERGCMESAKGASISSATRWRTKFKGDVKVEYDLALTEEPQNLTTDIYYDPAKANHYSVVFGLDLVIGDMEERMQMPKTAILKYPTGFSKDKAKLPAEWDKLKQRLVGAATADVAVTMGKKIHVEIVRTGKKIELLVDRKPVWDGEDAEYNEGYLLFFADSRAQIDNLQIVFKP